MTDTARKSPETPTRSGLVATRRRLPLGSRLDRYVAAHFVASYAAALGLMLGLFLILDMAGKLDDWLEPWPDGSTVSYSLLARYYLYELPFQYMQIAPFVTLLAGMFTVNRLLRKNEVSAVLSAGISVHRMMLPVFLGGLLLAVGMFAVREAVGHGLAEKRDALRDLLDTQGQERTFEGVVVRDLSGSFVILDRYLPAPDDGGPPRVEGLTMRLRQDGKYMRIDAPRAVWRDDAFVLEGGRRSELDFGERTAEVTAVEALEGFEIDPRIVATFHRSREPLDLAFSEVAELIRREPEHPAWLTLWHYHLTFPLANLVLLLVGIPVMFTYERGRGTERMALGGLICVFYFAADFIMRSLGLEGSLDPVWAAWLPVLAFGSLGVVLTDGVRT